MDRLDLANEIPLQDKVTRLEMTLANFQKEMERKMKIMERILTTRNEQYAVQKKLLDREHALYEEVMTEWNNNAELLQTTLINPFLQDPEAGNCRKRSSAAARRARLKRRTKSRVDEVALNLGETENNAFDECEDECETREAENEEDTQNFTSGEMERKVYVNYYTAEEDDGNVVGRRSRNPVWSYFLREENGNTAMCQLCDQVGNQRILRLGGKSTTPLHRHLKFRHGIQLESKWIAAEKEPFQYTENSEFEKAFVQASSSKRLLTSPVWNFFKRSEALEGKTKASCNLCKEEGKTTVYSLFDGSTSILHTHLKRVHSIDPKERKIERDNQSQDSIVEDNSPDISFALCS